MEELAKLEAERGNPEYEQADGGERRRMLSRQQEMEREEYGSRKSGAEKTMRGRNREVRSLREKREEGA